VEPLGLTMRSCKETLDTIIKEEKLGIVKIFMQNKNQIPLDL